MLDQDGDRYAYRNVAIHSRMSIWRVLFDALTVPAYVDFTTLACLRERDRPHAVFASMILRVESEGVVYLGIKLVEQHTIRPARDMALRQQIGDWPAVA